MAVLEDVATILRRIDKRLSTIETVLAKPDLQTVLVKDNYTVAEVADLTQVYGQQKYKTFTVRQACNRGYVDGAYKTDSGSWRVPRTAVLRVLQDGLPPRP